LDSILNYTATTYNVKISVGTNYEENMSDADNQLHVFSYEILIENLGDEALHLLSRHWDIIDALGLNHDVDGEGVVGEKPVILPGDSYTYSSSCRLTTDAGKMYGNYTMRGLSTDRLIQVKIPEFLLVPKHRMN
jgi:ApaG protein